MNKLESVSECENLSHIVTGIRYDYKIFSQEKLYTLGQPINLKILSYRISRWLILINTRKKIIGKIYYSILKLINQNIRGD